MNKMTWLFVIGPVVLILAGCMTTSQPTSSTDGAPASDLSWAGSYFQVGTEHRTNEIENSRQHRETGKVWHKKELKAAAEGKVVEAPTTQVAGSLPGVFINERSVGVWVTYWYAEDPNPRKPRVYVPSLREGQANYIEVYLRAGTYCFSAVDKWGNEIKLRRNKNEKPGPIGEFPVFNEPLRPWMGRDYFFRLILPNH